MFQARFILPRHAAVNLIAGAAIWGWLSLSGITPAGAEASPNRPHHPSANPKAALPKPVKRPTKPLWNELAIDQQQALVPLSAKWDTLSEVQKRKWLALSRNFPKMSGAQQVMLHSRMSEWAALSPQQRIRARLNFGETRQLSTKDKKAKWETYQALPAAEKRRLAAKAAKATKLPATAAAVKPVSRNKLAIVPKLSRRAAAAPPIQAASKHNQSESIALPIQTTKSPSPAAMPVN